MDPTQLPAGHQRDLMEVDDDAHTTSLHLLGTFQAPLFRWRGRAAAETAVGEGGKMNLGRTLDTLVLENQHWNGKTLDYAHYYNTVRSRYSNSINCWTTLGSKQTRCVTECSIFKIEKPRRSLRLIVEVNLDRITPTLVPMFRGSIRLLPPGRVQLDLTGQFLHNTSVNALLPSLPRGYLPKGRHPLWSFIHLPGHLI